MHRSDSATQLDNISPAEVSGGFPTTWKTLCWYYPPDTGRDFSAEYREAARTNSLLVLQAEKSRSQSTEDWQRHLAALYHSPHAHAALTWLSEHPEDIPDWINDAEAVTTQDPSLVSLFRAAKLQLTSTTNSSAAVDTACADKRPPS